MPALEHEQATYFFFFLTRVGNAVPRAQFVLHMHTTPVTFIQVAPLGCFTHVYITTPIVPALKNYYV
jgi:hypothetical protein